MTPHLLDPVKVNGSLNRLTCVNFTPSPRDRSAKTAFELQRDLVPLDSRADARDSQSSAQFRSAAADDVRQLEGINLRSLVSALAFVAALCIAYSVPLYAAPGGLVAATNRLNLRECPNTTGCSIRRTLDPETHLEVLGRQDIWLRVRALDNGDTGWVHGDYTKIVEVPQAPRDESHSFVAELRQWQPALFGLTALFVTAFVTSRYRKDIPFQRMLTLITGNLIIGSLFLLNQFGPSLQTLLLPFVDLTSASFLWTADLPDDWKLSYLKLLAVTALIGAGIAGVAGSANGRRQAFLQGAAIGFLGLPAVALALGLLGLVLYILGWVVKFLGWLIGALLTPVAWLVEHILLPFLRWLATPLIWLWENYIRDALLWLATPFIWLWTNILAPIGAFLARYVVQPILWIGVRVLLAAACLLPVSALGAVLLGNVRNTLFEAMNRKGLFVLGVTVGITLLDGVLLVALELAKVGGRPPSLTYVFFVALSGIGLVRLWMLGGMQQQEKVEGNGSLRENMQHYFRLVRLDVIASCVIIPLNFIAQLMGPEE